MLSNHPKLTSPRHVKTLVGEIDFSFKAIKPSSMDSDESLGSSLESMDDKKPI